MSATGNGLSGEDYFRSIEVAFVGLRGAPLLLSPADWQTANRWHEAGHPVVGRLREVMEECFRAPARASTRNAGSRALSYCAPAVEEAWREIQDLSATDGTAWRPESVDVPERLRRWLGALPALPP